MLVLSRKQDSSINIGSEVVITILGIRGSHVKVGIEAPEAIQIWRSEVAPRDQVTPYIRGAEPQDREAGHSSDKPVSDKPVFKVLLVEDDPGHAKLICGILTESLLSRPVDLVIARTGESAMESLGMAGDLHAALKFAPFDLVLLDLYLPRMTGLDILLKIRTDPLSYLTPVVFLTCAEDDITTSNCLDAGANAVVSKSGDPGAFRASVNRIADFWGNESRVPRQQLFLAE